MIDDMQGLFKSASQAYEAGKKSGREDLYKLVMAELSRVSVAFEKSGDVVSFHAAEKAQAAVRIMRQRKTLS